MRSLDTDYDITLGPGRFVSSFNPLEHQYVIRYCQPIVLKKIDHKDVNPDEAMKPDNQLFEEEKETDYPKLQKARKAIQENKERRFQERLNLFIKTMKEHGRPDISSVWSEKLNMKRDEVVKFIKNNPEYFCIVFYRGRLAYYGLIDGGYDIPDY